MIALVPVNEDAGKHAAAIAVSDGNLGPHVGVLHETAKGERSILHLRFNHDLRNDPIAKPGRATGKASGQPPEPATWWALVPPEIDEIELAVLADWCGRVAREKPDIPFGFRYEATKFVDQRPRLALGPSETGLTCATFVLAMFDYAKISLIQGETWMPRASDATAFERLIELLVAKGASREHVAAVRKEVNCVRYRAEEVAAASSFQQRPVSFADCAPAGEELAEMFYTTKEKYAP